MNKKSKQREREFDEQWGQLAQYNAEVAHGMEFSDLVKEYMAKKQAAYDKWAKEQM